MREEPPVCELRGLLDVGDLGWERWLRTCGLLEFGPAYGPSGGSALEGSSSVTRRWRIWLSPFG